MVDIGAMNLEENIVSITNDPSHFHSHTIPNGSRKATKSRGHFLINSSNRMPKNVGQKL